ncbi:hypothetical protein ACFLYO_03750 [Chloroflexota bacterium]
MAKTFDIEEVQREIDEYLTDEGRQWLADLLHDHIGPPVGNSSMQAEIVLRAWESHPDMALSEMQELKGRLDKASALIVLLVRTITPQRGS